MLLSIEPDVVLWSLLQMKCLVSAGRQTSAGMLEAALNRLEIARPWLIVLRMETGWLGQDLRTRKRLEPFVEARHGNSGVEGVVKKRGEAYNISWRSILT